MFEQRVDGSDIFNQRRRTSLAWQRQAIHFFEDLGKFPSDTTSNALRLNVIR